MELNSESFIYLDHAATSFPKSRSVLDYMADFYARNGVNPGRSGGDLQRLANEIIDETRTRLQQLCAAPERDRVVFTANATMSLNLTLAGLLEPGDHVITTVTEHNSVLRPLNHLKETRGIAVTWLEPESSGVIDPAQVEEAIGSKTRMLVLNHASNVTGTIQNLEGIGGVCRERGLIFIVDGAQTAGAVPIDMAAAGIDGLAVTGHKSLGAPAGIGALLLSNRIDPAPLLYGGTGVDSRNPVQPAEYPFHLEAGTVNLPGIAGLNAALRELEKNDMAAAKRELDYLLQLMARGLSGIDLVRIHGFDRNVPRMPLLSITVEGWDPEAVGTFLDVDYNIICRTGLHCAPMMHDFLGTGEQGSLRLSLGTGNTRQDVEACITALEEIAAMD
jgi:cysteine desulfurase family protein